MSKNRNLLDEYRFPGFRPKARIKGIFGDPRARIIRLERRQKKLFAVFVEQFAAFVTIQKREESGICHVVKLGCTWNWNYGGLSVPGAEK